MDMISVHIVLMIIELNMYSYVRAAALESAQSLLSYKRSRMRNKACKRACSEGYTIRYKNYKVVSPPPEPELFPFLTGTSVTLV